MDARRALDLVTDLLHNAPNRSFKFARLEDTWMLRTYKEGGEVRFKTMMKTRLLHICQPEKAYEMLHTNKSAAPFMGLVNDDGLCWKCKKSAPDKVFTRWRIIAKLHAAPVT
jgi:hypothetical protein